MSAWDRETLVAEMRSYPSRFPVDLTAEFLADLPVDRLRHLFFALCVQNQRLPAAAFEFTTAA